MDRAAMVIELCGRLADPLGPELVIDGGAGCTAGELIARIIAAAPPLAPLLAAGRVRVCVNEVVVPADHRIAAGDLIALFPPVSGG